MTVCKERARASEPAKKTSELGWMGSEPDGRGFGPARMGLEPAGRCSEPAGRISEQAVTAPDPAGKALEPAGRAFEPPGWVSGPACGVLESSRKALDHLGLGGCEGHGASWEPHGDGVDRQKEWSVPDMWWRDKRKKGKARGKQGCGKKER